MDFSTFDFEQDFGLNPQRWGENNKLMQAIQKRNYSAIRALLSKAELPFSMDEGLQYCVEAIRSSCSCRSIERLLDACPPGEELYTATDFFGDRRYEHLEKEAVKHDRSDVLRMLMQRDISDAPLSTEIMETALSRGSVACTHLLTQQPGLDWAANDMLQYVWGRLGLDPAVDLCLRRVAPVVTGVPFSEKGEIPLPDFLTIQMVVFHENWALLERICRERTIDRKQGEMAICGLFGHREGLEGEELARLLDCLFKACPGLLRCHFPRYVLAVTMVNGGEGAQQLLRPHLEAMPGKRIHLFPGEGAQRCVHWNGSDGLLRRWDEVLGKAYYPVLYRNRGLSRSFFFLPDSQMQRDRDLEELLTRCRITGAPRPGRVSVLAQEILEHASPGLILRLMERGGALEEEPARAMLEWCGHRGLWNSRAAILAGGKKEVRYEL